ncbi:MAG: hypothetical protein LPL29_13325 [Alphaproteobacteria bacterium]|nr:hypothetical protein [Alphaproteobacteria bacterium]
MGAVFSYMVVRGDLPHKEVKAKFEAEQDQDRYENGHMYSGGLGMAHGLTFRDDVAPFKTMDEAYEWVETEAEKWGPALAVRVVEDDAGGSKSAWFIGAICAS